jgi:RimJ/RimL family protein N-acetyltransferase
MGKLFVTGGGDRAGMDEQIAQWMAQRTPQFQYGASPYACIGLVNQVGGIVAGALFENYTHVDIHAHIAAERLTRHFLGECFRYCFETEGVDRITCPVLTSNKYGEPFVKKLGFVLEGRMRRRALDGSDVLIYGMLREECRWLTAGHPREKLKPPGPTDRSIRIQCRT